jgi:hypothetical protein
MRTSIVIITAALSLATAAPIHQTRPILPRHDGSEGGLDIDVADVPLVGEAVSSLVDALPVDVSLDAPVLPDKRDPGVNIDLGGAGISVKRDLDVKRDPGVNIDLGGAGISVKRDAANN